MTTTAKRPGPTQVQHVEIDASHSGQRLDNYLLTHLKGVPRTHIYRLLRRGEVRINSGRKPPSYRLQNGDIVRIPPIRQSPARKPARTPQTPAWLDAIILYEDERLLVLDKPAGMAVHGGSGISLGLIESVRQLRPNAPYMELAHRLDRETSGCLILAKRRSALTALHAQLRNGEIDKRYLALVQGRLAGRPRQVEAALHKYQHQSGERMVRVNDLGKPAVSRIKPIQQFAAATLVEIALITGRTHQARVHCAHIGHPIAGDEKYGDREFNREMNRLGLTRMFLHAASITFAHPASNSKLSLHSELPPALAAIIEKMK